MRVRTLVCHPSCAADLITKLLSSKFLKRTTQGQNKSHFNLNILIGLAQLEMTPQKHAKKWQTFENVL